MIEQLDAVRNIILSEVNVKEIEYITDTTGVLVKRIKPNFKTLGPKYGKYMKQISALVAEMQQSDIFEFEKNGRYELHIGEKSIVLGLEDVEILSEDIPGWLVANEGRLTVALDITVTESLRKEGLARELVNRIQNLRKSNGYDITDKINVTILSTDEMDDAIKEFNEYIANQVLAVSVEITEHAISDATVLDFEDFNLSVRIEKE